MAGQAKGGIACFFPFAQLTVESQGIRVRPRRADPPGASLERLLDQSPEPERCLEPITCNVPRSNRSPSGRCADGSWPTTAPSRSQVGLAGAERAIAEHASVGLRFHAKIRAAPISFGNRAPFSGLHPPWYPGRWPWRGRKRAISWTRTGGADGNGALALDFPRCSNHLHSLTGTERRSDESDPGDANRREVSVATYLSAHSDHRIEQRRLNQL
jgi:hypothetical protein